MAAYRLGLNRKTGKWEVQFRNNDPIEHDSSREAYDTLRHLLYLEGHYNRTMRGRTRRFDGL